MTRKGRGGSAKFPQSDRVTRNSTKNLRNNTTDPYTLEDDRNTKKVKETGDKNNNIEQHDNVMDMDITLDTYGTNIHNTGAQTTLVTKLISETRLLPTSSPLNQLMTVYTHLMLIKLLKTLILKKRIMPLNHQLRQLRKNVLYR